MAKVGILTFSTAINYGAVLQAFALKEKVESYGQDVEVINYTPVLIEKKYKLFNDKKMKGILKGVVKAVCFGKRACAFHRFVEKMSSSKIKTLKDLSERGYDKIIVGSDQVWNISLSGNDKIYLLPCLETKKYSYAASFGVSQLERGEIAEFQKRLGDFRVLSVREKTGASVICEKQLELKAEVVLDPVFLLTGKRWVEEFQIKENRKKYVLVYALGLTNEVKRVAKKVSDQLGGLPVLYINGDILPWAGFGDKTIRNASPKKWVELFYNATFIVTDSFHGTAFSVNFHKNFYTFAKTQTSSRMVDMLEMFGLQDRVNPSFEKVNATEPIDYIAASVSIEKERQKSVALIEKIVAD